MRSLLLLALALSPTTGCYRYATDIPGVLDLRSDGTEAPSRSEPPVAPEAKREGLLALFAGPGVREDGADITVEDRHVFGGATLLAPGLFLLTNDSAFPELKATLREEGLRDLRVGQRRTGMDVALELGVAMVPGLGCATLLVAPRPFTFTASGRRVVLQPPQALPAEAEGGTP
jgi:hypothetical protein